MKNIEWTAYENIHKKYLILGKSNIKFKFKFCNLKYTVSEDRLPLLHYQLRSVGFDSRSVCLSVI